jgi:hypothetical protein
MDYRHPYAREPRITLASVLLLAVFVSAAVFIVSAIVWQPWNAGDATVIAPSNEDAVIEEPVSDSLDGELDVLVQPAAE